MDNHCLCCIFKSSVIPYRERFLEREEASAVEEFEILRRRQTGISPARDVVAREEPLEVRMNGRTLVYLMRLPGDEVPLAVGFCVSEGIIQERGQIELVHHCQDGPGNLVEIKASLASGTERFGEARVVRTGCGGADLDREVDLDAVRVESETRFPASVIASAPDLLLERQEVFTSTGGTHGAGIFDDRGRVLVVKEDVGRHNAVDKVLGYMLLSGEPTGDKGLVLSGRLSYEMVLKAARAGLPLICSVSAPTSLGVEVGVRTGVTMVGFLRGGNFNIYSHPERVGGD